MSEIPMTLAPVCWSGASPSCTNAGTIRWCEGWICAPCLAVEEPKKEIAKMPEPMTPTDAQGTCEVVEVEQPGTFEFCGQPAVFRYPALGGGYMRLCKLHGRVHQSYCERWSGDGWTSRREATR